MACSFALFKSNKPTVSHSDAAPSEILTVHILFIISCFTAGVTTVIGLLSVLAWHGDSGWVGSTFPLAYDSKYNTSIGLCAVGFGLFAAIWQNMTHLRIAGVCILLLAVSTLVEYIAGINLGIDQLLMEDAWGSATLHPGRMAPNSAVCFLLLAIIMLALGTSINNSWYPLVMESMVFMVFAISLVALCGRFVSADVVYNWGTYAQMAPQAAIAFLSAGICLAMYLWCHVRSHILRLPIWIPTLICFFVFWFDLSTPLGVAAGAAYLPLIFCSLWFANPSAPFLFAGIASILAVVGYFTSPPSDLAVWIGITNRALTIGALWTIAIGVYMIRQNSLARNQSESHLRSVVETVLDGLLTIDHKGVIRSFNHSAERIFGYSEDEVIGRNVKMLMPDPYHSEHDGYLKNYLTTGDKKVIGIGREVSGKRKDGRIFSMELGVNEMKLDGARMFVGTVRDISARKEAEAQIKVEAARMLAVMNTVLDGLITIDEKGIIQTFNPASVRIFGYEPDEVIGQNVKMLMPEPYHSGHDGYLNNYMTTGSAKVIGIGREVAAKRKDGSVFPMELGVNEMHVVGKRMFVGTIRDISQRKQAEHEIQQYLAALKRSNQELDDFAYIASHDLKEPLRGLSNNAMFIKEDYEAIIGEDGKKRLNRITYLCERMERLVNDLLYFSRLGRQELAIQRTDLNDIIRDIEAMMDTTLHETHAKIIIAEKLPTIVCDLPRITEVFRNLISNAVKYNLSTEKRIEIGCIHQNGERVFFVRDNGMGIPEEFYYDVFRIFKRLNEEDDNIKGTGVGLTFVKKIIERHHGRIWIDSKMGVGTTFYFTIPEQ